MKTAVGLRNPSTHPSLSSQQVDLQNTVPGCREEKANVLSIYCSLVPGRSSYIRLHTSCYGNRSLWSDVKGRSGLVWEIAGFWVFQDFSCLPPHIYVVVCGCLRTSASLTREKKESYTQPLVSKTNIQGHLYLVRVFHQGLSNGEPIPQGNSRMLCAEFDGWK